MIVTINFLLRCIRREPGIRTETLKQLLTAYDNTKDPKYERLKFTNDFIIRKLEKSGKARPKVEGCGAMWWYRWYPCKSKRESKKAFEDVRNKIRTRMDDRKNFKRWIREEMPRLLSTQSN